jgi:hypothetical protein
MLLPVWYQVGRDKCWAAFYVLIVQVLCSKHTWIPGAVIYIVASFDSASDPREDRSIRPMVPSKSKKRMTCSSDRVQGERCGDLVGGENLLERDRIQHGARAA